MFKYCAELFASPIGTFSYEVILEWALCVISDEGMIKKHDLKDISEIAARLFCVRGAGMLHV